MKWGTIKVVDIFHEPMHHKHSQSACGSIMSVMFLFFCVVWTWVSIQDYYKTPRQSFDLVPTQDRIVPAVFACESAMGCNISYGNDRGMVGGCRQQLAAELGTEDVDAYEIFVGMNESARLWICLKETAYSSTVVRSVFDPTAPSETIKAGKIVGEENNEVTVEFPNPFPGVVKHVSMRLFWTFSSIENSSSNVYWVHGASPDKLETDVPCSTMILAPPLFCSAFAIRVDPLVAQNTISYDGTLFFRIQIIVPVLSGAFTLSRFLKLQFRRIKRNCKKHCACCPPDNQEGGEKRTNYDLHVRRLSVLSLECQLEGGDVPAEAAESRNGSESAWSPDDLSCPLACYKRQHCCLYYYCCCYCACPYGEVDKVSRAKKAVPGEVTRTPKRRTDDAVRHDRAGADGELPLTTVVDLTDDLAMQ